MTGAAPLSVLVTARDEEETIGACLDSVGWAAEIVVVDSGSRDDTVAIARAHGARVLEHEYESPARQKNWALPQCAHEWVLILDADERVPDALRDEIRQLLADGPRADGYWIRRENEFLGRVMRHGTWASDRVIRLVRRDRARYDDRLVHEEIDLPGPLPQLAQPLRHAAFRSFDQYWPKVDRYARWGAAEAWRRGRRASAASVLGRTVARFLRAYVVKAGFLDGGRGLVLAFFSSYTTFLKYARLWEMGLVERRAAPAAAKTKPGERESAAR
ncbi:MAG: glycosyltransferase family 2 protein [Acidobacteria bacterium]|nr:glycosyltransferase family 2 protein [Acidobacteriota bacterium]